jgi:hypothetical protein
MALVQYPNFRKEMIQKMQTIEIDIRITSLESQVFCLLICFVSYDHLPFFLNRGTFLYY